MPRAKGRLVAVVAVTAGIATLAAAGVAFRGRIVEEWQLHRLRTGDRQVRKEAAKALGEMGSVRALSEILNQLNCSGVDRSDWAMPTPRQWLRSTYFEFDSEAIDAVVGIVRAQPGEATSIIRNTQGQNAKGMNYLCAVALQGWNLDSREDQTRLSDRSLSVPATAFHVLVTGLEDGQVRVRRASAAILRNLEGAASPVAPALQKALDDPDPEVRATAAQALEKIRVAESSRTSP